MNNSVLTIVGLIAMSMIKNQGSGSFSLGHNVFDLIHAHSGRYTHPTRIFFKNDGSDKPLRDTSKFVEPRWQYSLSKMDLPNVKVVSFLRVTHVPPVGLGNLKKTRKLSIRFCPIPKLPDDIFELENLEELSIQGTNIVQISNKISRLKKLKILRIYDNKHLKQIPESIAELENLEELRINGCDIRRLPKNIHALPKLKTLIIAPSKPWSVFGYDRPYNADDIDGELYQSPEERKRLDNHNLRVTPMQRFVWTSFLEANKKDKRIQKTFKILLKIKVGTIKPQNEIRRF